MNWQDEEMDRTLRDAYEREHVETSEAKDTIRAEIGRATLRQRILWRAAAAVMLAGALGGAFRALRSPVEPKVFVDAVRDHRIEVVGRAPRRWRTSDGDINLLAARFGMNREQLGFTGYRLMRAKICLLQGQRVMHLVYSDGAAEFSLYLLPGEREMRRIEVQNGSELIASFQGHKAAGLVVGEGSTSDCRRLADAVRRGL